MKKITFKKFIYWLLGETAGRTLVGTWKWVWGLPVESGGKIAQKVAQESFQSMQESIAQLTEGVSKVVAGYKLAQERYDKKQQELQEAEQQAELTYRRGDEEAARLLITKAIAIEKIMPQLKQQVERAKQIATAATEKLKKEKEKLQAYKLDMANMKAVSELNEIMASIHHITTDLDIDSARSQFEEAKGSVEGRYVYETTRDELAEDETEKIQTNIDKLSLDEQINSRLEKFKK
ncbi:MAG: PspA/IM30 family protein [Waterburya sp.]